jgi:2'-5' RNA ligase
MNYHRAFVAINLPEKVKKAIVEATSEWQNWPVRWTFEQNLHLTLVFLGNITDDEILTIGEKITEAAANTESFSLRFNKFIYGPKDFTETNVPRMIWLEGEKNEKLTKLQNDLEKVFGMMENKRVLRPHITIGRIKTFGLRKINEFPKTLGRKIELTIPVSSIELMESDLTPKGPIYTILLSVKLSI